MKNKQRITYNLGIIFLSVIVFSACGGVHSNASNVGEGQSSAKANKQTETLPTSGMVNPALAYCTKNNHNLISVKDRLTGLTSYYLCVNKAAHKKCSANAYYRGDCSL